MNAQSATRSSQILEDSDIGSSEKTPDDPPKEGGLVQVLDQNSRVEDAIARALEAAAAAGQWGVVSALAKELEARRLEGSNVTPINRTKARGGR